VELPFSNNEVASIKITSDAVEELESWFVHKHIDLSREVEKEDNELEVVREMDGNEVQVGEKEAGGDDLTCLANLTDAQGNALLSVNDESDDELEEVFEKLKKFVKDNKLQLKNPNDDYETALWEMVLTINECVGNVDDMDKMKEVFDGWVATEDSDFSEDTMKDEIEELLDIEVLAGLKEVPEEDDEEEEGADNAMMMDADIERETMTSDTLHELTTQLKSLAVKVGTFEEEYGSVSSSLNDAVDDLQSTFRKIDNKRKSNKKDNRQGFLDCYVETK